MLARSFLPAGFLALSIALTGCKSQSTPSTESASRSISPPAVPSPAVQAPQEPQLAPETAQQPDDAALLARKTAEYAQSVTPMLNSPASRPSVIQWIQPAGHPAPTDSSPGPTLSQLPLANQPASLAAVHLKEDTSLPLILPESRRPDSLRHNSNQCRSVRHRRFHAHPDHRLNRRLRTKAPQASPGLSARSWQSARLSTPPPRPRRAHARSVRCLSTHRRRPRSVARPDGRAEQLPHRRPQQQQPDAEQQNPAAAGDGRPAPIAGAALNPHRRLLHPRRQLRRLPANDRHQIPRQSKQRTNSLQRSRQFHVNPGQRFHLATCASGRRWSSTPTPA